MVEGNIQGNETNSTTKTVVLASATWERGSVNTPVYAVISAVAEASGTDPFDLPPLATVIDPEALNALFTSRSDSSVRRIQFEYTGYEIIVRGDGAVYIQHTSED